jgi:transcriptional regulator with XRE-family HTH domain
MSPLARREDRLGAVVHRLRLERGITQKALALKANISISGLSRIERGLSSPVFSTLIELADALEISLNELACAAEDGET